MSLVEQDIAVIAGFNWGEASLLMPGGLTVYLGTRVPWGDGSEREPTIVVVERRMPREDGWERIEWHVGTIDGPPIGERMGQQAEEFLSAVKKIAAARKTRVAGMDLQRAIAEANEKLHMSPNKQVNV